jgi:mRNA interferase HigB
MRYEIMSFISRQTLVRAGEQHPDAKASLMHWESVAKAADWATPLEAQAAFSKAKALNGERVRFEIGDGYRLIVAFRWDLRIAWIKFFGSHAEHDKVDALTVSDY